MNQRKASAGAGAAVSARSAPLLVLSGKVRRRRSAILPACTSRMPPATNASASRPRAAATRSGGTAAAREARYARDRRDDPPLVPQLRAGLRARTAPSAVAARRRVASRRGLHPEQRAAALSLAGCRPGGEGARYPGAIPCSFMRRVAHTTPTTRPTSSLDSADKHGGEARLPVAHGLVAGDAAVREEHRRQIALATFVARSPQHDQQHRVGRVLAVLGRRAGALAQRRAPGLRGGRGRGTAAWAGQGYSLQRRAPSRRYQHDLVRTIPRPSSDTTIRKTRCCPCGQRHSQTAGPGQRA